VSFSIEGFFEKGGQNKIYLATMEKDGERVPIVTKTPLDDKDFKFLEYLKKESLILQ
jgi:DNA repair photolyase